MHLKGGTLTKSTQVHATNIMVQKLEIRPLNIEEMPTMLSWAEREGWNPGLNDHLSFWGVDRHGFIGGFLHGRLVAIISAVRYQDKFGFVGFYIVAPEYRGLGYGRQVWDAALKHLDGIASVGLDGVVEQQERYTRSGFVYAHRNCRYQGLAPLRTTASSLSTAEEILPAGEVPFEALASFDRNYFPTDRSNFLHDWISTANHRGLVVMKDGHVLAYGVIRKCASGHKIGPLFAHTKAHARALIEALCVNSDPNIPVYIDLPAENQEAISLVQELGMSMVFETARMYKGLAPQLPIGQIYGITTFELG